MRYHYTALDTQGTLQQGEAQAENSLALANTLQEHGLVLLSQRPLWLSLLSRQTGLTRQERLHFCFQLEQLLASGLPLLDCLKDMASGSPRTGWQQVIESLHQRIAQGQTFGQALHAHPDSFDPIFIQLIHAGEQSGELPTILGQLAEQLQWQTDTHRQSRQALIYPLFTATTVGLASLFLLLFLVPQLRLFLRNMGQTLPWHSQLLFTLSDLLQAHGLSLFFLLTGLLTATGLALRLQPAVRHAADRLILHLPIFGPILRQTILARLANILALLYRAGIPLLSALHQLPALAGNRAIHDALSNAAERVRQGESLSQAFAQQPIFPPLFIRMLTLGEQTGHLEISLRNLGAYYQREIRSAVSRVQALTEPCLTLLLGLLLGWLMLAVIGPIYDVISQLRP